MPPLQRLAIARRDRAQARLLRRALIISAAFHLTVAAPFVVGVMLLPHPTPQPQPVFAQVELIQQDTPTVGDAPARMQPAPPASATTPQTPVPPVPPDQQAEVAAAPRTVPPQPSQAPAAAPPDNSEEPAVRLGDAGETGTGLVSGAAVIPAGVNSKVHNRLPTYPAEAARRGEEGVVVVLVQIAPDGSASAVDVGESSGYEVLDQAARAAISRWRFRPAVQDGVPIASTMEVEVHFTIRHKPS